MSRLRLLVTAPLIASLAGILPAIAAAEDPLPTGKLAVQVLGVQGTNGRVCVAIWDDPDSYPDEGKHARSSCAKAKDGKAYITFKNLPPGAYAAFAFHDADSNGKIKTNFIGMPKEGVGASRGAKGFMGPPKFKDARFEVGTDRKFIQIRLKYL